MKSAYLVSTASLILAAMMLPHLSTLYAQTPAIPVLADEAGPDLGDDDQGGPDVESTPPENPEPADIQAADNEAADDQQDVQVLARGPVHEAFADPVTFEPRESELVERAPPQPIQEQPPEVKPDGNPLWIPGYWAWDDERKDFLWVSGAWRVPPGGQRWVPGYWADVDGGHKWVPGFWTAEQAQEVNYLPQPPATQERGPNSPTPGEDYFWVPGNWYYQQSNYVWTPGYWTQVQPSWVWMPARYYWTPSGYVFVRGYWDYPIVRRGWLFAPVYFAPGYYARPGFYYSPTAVVDVGALSLQLFVRPRWGCYYFGDYYGPAYAGIGFYPWFRWGGVGIGYDPIFTYQRWYYRHHGDEHWEHHIHQDFARRERDPQARPPHVMHSGANVAAHNRLAMPLNQFVEKKDVQNHVERLNANQREQFAKSAHEMHNFQGQRQKLELKNAAISGPAGPQGKNLGERASLKLPDSGITGSARDKLGGQTAPGRNTGGVGNDAARGNNRILRGNPNNPNAAAGGGGAQSSINAQPNLGGQNLNKNRLGTGGVQSPDKSQFGGSGVDSSNKGSALPGVRQNLNNGQLGSGAAQGLDKSQFGGSRGDNLNKGSTIPGVRQNLNNGQFGPGGGGNVNKGQGGPPAVQNFNRPPGGSGGPPQGKGGPANRIDRKENRKPAGGDHHGSNDQQPILSGGVRALSEIDRTPRAPASSGIQPGSGGMQPGIRRETLRPVDPGIGARGDAGQPFRQFKRLDTAPAPRVNPGGGGGGPQIRPQIQQFQPPTAGPAPRINLGGAGGPNAAGKGPASQAAPGDAAPRNRDKNRPN